MTQLPPPSHADREAALGVLLLVVAALLWSLNGAFIKFINASGGGPSGLAIAFYRSLFAGVFLLPFGWSRLGSILGTPSQPAHAQSGVAIAAACVTSFTLMTTCFVIANTMTQAANAIILQYTSTLWVFLLSPLLLREAPDQRERWLLILAMIGIGIIFAGNASTDLAGLLIALAAGLFYGLLTLLLRKLRYADPAAVTVMNNLGAAVLLLPPLLVAGGFGQTPRIYALLALMGVVQFGVPYLLFSMALRRVPAHRAALLTVIEPLLVPLWTYLAVRETVSAYTIAGGVAILAALAVMTVRARS